MKIVIFQPMSAAEYQCSVNENNGGDQLYSSNNSGTADRIEMRCCSDWKSNNKRSKRWKILQRRRRGGGGEINSVSWGWGDSDI